MGHSAKRSATGAGRQRRLLSAGSWVALASVALSPALAQVPEPEPQPQAPDTAVAQPPVPETDERQIVVIGNRIIVASLESVEPERTYDEDEIASYAASTIGELLDVIRDENGDREPSILINGRPVEDLGDIANLPVEAIQSIEALPRGSAQRVGGAAGQRAYNVVLRPSVTSATVTGSVEAATEGGWSNKRGETLFTYIRNQDRLNITFRGSESGALFESERDFIPRMQAVQYSAIGNIIPAGGIEVDPLLSALAGQLATVVALPKGNLNPTLAALVPGVNEINPSDEQFYRSLRGASRPLEIAIAGNKALTPELSLSFNGRIAWSETTNFRGLPRARFSIPASHPSSPFSGPVILALHDPSRPLRSTSEGTSGAFSATLNANLGSWHGNLMARLDESERTSLSQTSGSLGRFATVDTATNPFAGTLVSLIPVSTRASDSKTSSRQLTADAQGPLFRLWAGPVQGRIGLGATWLSLDATSGAGERTFERREYLGKAGVTLPLTSREQFIPWLGDSELAVDAALVDLGQYGTLERHSVALNWQPLQWLRIVATQAREEQAISPELLAAPDVATPNVPYFDPLTGQTVDVTTIYGGAADLENQVQRIRTLSATVTAFPKYNLQLNADYEVNDLDNEIGALPPPSSAVVLAFPDRFVRDAAGTLILVDNRSVNFARQHDERLRFGMAFRVSIVEDQVIPADRKAGTPRRRIPGVRLQVNASHTVLLDSTTVIRTGLPEVDLLAGGAIGIGGGQQKHYTTAALALTSGSSGLRLDTRRRGASFLITGTREEPDLLTFRPITTLDFKAFADLERFFPSVGIAKDTRFTLTFENLLNKRQRVTNASDVTPQAYQPIYRDPIGRTVQVELRKVF
jgi:hypothetical protein